MSVSLSQVQGALQGLSNGGGSGPLTLTVLQKTEAITAALKALTGGKPVSVEVLSAQANGRASVVVGDLTLAVKASLPLKAGEVFSLKVEQTGYSLKLVQPLDAALTNAESAGKGALPAPKPGDAAGVLKSHSPLAQRGGGEAAPQGQAVRGAATPQPGAGQRAAVQRAEGALQAGGAPPLNAARGEAGRVPLATQQLQPQANVQPQQGQQQQGGVAGQPAAARSLAPVPANGVLPGGQISNGQINTGQVSLTQGAPAPTVSAAPAPPAALSAALPAVNIIRAVAEALPAVAGKVSAKPAKGQTLKAAALPDGRAALPGGEAGRGGALLQETQSGYQRLAGQALSGGVIEEIAELQGRAGHKGPDVTLDFPLGEAGKQIAVGLYVLPDGSANDEEAAAKRYAVSFSLETAETGPVHAELMLQGQRLALQLWAETAHFYELLEMEFAQLQQRLEAVGLHPGALRLRRGRPRQLTHEQHLEQEA